MALMVIAHAGEGFLKIRQQFLGLIAAQSGKPTLLANWER
jgi:hypothetical protein